MKLSELARSLTIVGGKGGVGKTTVACALAIAGADRNTSTLLVSTDPAPSVGDALDQKIGDADEAVDGVANLSARQMDATAAFAAFRDEYRGRIDALFESLSGRGLDIAQDREILRDLLSLAPPGIDELYALTVLGDTIEEGRFARIIIDPAPTGHLLRLLDMPSQAVAWSHQLMRLMLKYKDVVGLGETAQGLLEFAKRTRALDRRLHDPALAATVLVALDESLVRGETERLLRALSDRQLLVSGIVWNRAAASTPPLPTSASIPQLFAPLVSPPPRGVAAIREWSAAWCS
jgi:arsenite-transporting ATPase